MSDDYEDRIRLNAFDHRRLAESSVMRANAEYSKGDFEEALRFYTKARDHYIVWGSSQKVGLLQRPIDFCLIKLGRMDPRSYGIGHVDGEEKPKKPRKKRKKKNNS